jgi:hypothetical protein
MINRNFGHFHFSVSSVHIRDPFPLFDIELIKGHVDEMVYIPSESFQIVKNIEFRCIILDATFKLIPNFVVSLISGILFNAYLPLGFIIGHSENAELYQNFYSTFFNQTRFDLSEYPALSDRHTGIRSFCVQNNIQKFICVVHILRSFGGKHQLLYGINKL